MTRRLLITVIATLLTATTAPADTFIYVSVAAEKCIAVFRLDADTGKLTHRSDCKVGDSSPQDRTTG
jgi:hypothetical protein